MTFDPSLDREPLSDDERAWLRDAELGRRSGPPSLSSRHVTDLSLSGLAFGGSWSQALVERGTFVGCQFAEHDFSAATFRGVTFERCKLEHCQYDATVFDTCRFIGCELTESTAKGTSLHDCVFVESTLSGLTMYGARFDGVRMEGGRLADLRLSECMVHFWQLSATTLDGVRLTLCETGRIAMDGCAVAQMSILGGNYGSFELGGGALSDLLFANASVDTLKMLDVPASTRVRVNESKVSTLSFERCTVSDLYFWSSELQRVRLAEGVYEGSITECTIGMGEIIDAELRAFFWDGSVANDLTFARVLFQRFLCARAARFVGMRLQQVTFAPAVELELEGASFESGDAFSLSPGTEGDPR